MQKGSFTVATSQKMEFIDVTARIEREIGSSGVKDGICYLYNPHTTAGLTINEGADPAVQDDILSVLQKIVPLNYKYKHLEGNSPSHLMTSMVGTSATVFIEGGRLALGTWQRIFFCEFDGPRTRKLLWKILAADRP
ncbi:MAG: secondary thiamine-phosphate synthase enzyme YjbQ [Desulfobulbaceae bacterium]|nr:secondary thiamine-phosphate synthase enzyme YjbQ [Desulfobulbaceae bacterium]MCK5340003.1 secondary thiamine-phosphate synthase enzyme YjbQ [Desulfobulbaceae bacterium]MCK5403958.1 secondary thiamine-phosphate synthase enzyme YjbQ [Desulfobulbaceae bacterium]